MEECESCINILSI